LHENITTEKPIKKTLVSAPESVMLTVFVYAVDRGLLEYVSFGVKELAAS